MKTKLLIMLAFVLFQSFLLSVYASPAPMPEDSFRFSKYVLVGKILSVEIISEPKYSEGANVSGIALYTVKVEENLKNTIDENLTFSNDTNVIKVLGYFVREIDPIDVVSYPYEANQRVLLYIQIDSSDAVPDFDYVIRSDTSKVIGDSLCEEGKKFVNGICVIEESLFASKQITTIFSNSNYNDIKLLDWNPDGKTILLSYNQILEDGNYFSRLATFDVKSHIITDLGIPEKFYKDSSNWLYGQFSPSGEQIYFFVIDNREIYLFDILQKTTVYTGIQSDWFRVDSQGNIFYIKTGQTTSSTKGNPEYHLFKFDTKTNMTQMIAKDPSFWSFDVNADGTKILYRKEIESGYGWAQRDLAVYDVDAKTSTIIPNIEGEDCGQQPIFAPNDELMIYHVQSCEKGWSGGALGITNSDGNFEILTPPSSENPDSFVISPDGISLVYRHALYVNGTYVVGLSQMVLAKPIPEFGIVSALILAVSLISVVAIGAKFRNL